MATPMPYNPEIGDRICEQIALGQSVREICKDPSMPGMTTLFKWLQGNPDFAKQYAYSRELQGEAMFDRTLDIANEEPATDADGKVDTGDVQMKRLRIDVLKWRAGKLRPKVYGDKQEIEHSGSVDLKVDLANRLAKAQERVNEDAS